MGEQYIDIVSGIDPEWEEKMASGEVKKSSGMGVAVSTMAEPQENSIADEEKTIFDWCQDGNVKRIETFLENGADVNATDEQGMALLHWSCDRGHLNLVEMLANRNADLNVKDEDGQTPLHYACSCEHENIVKLLLERNADTSITDTDGLTPLECAESSSIKAMLLPT